MKAGNTVYIADQVALDANGQIVAVGDISAQTRHAFENLKTALASVDANFNNLARIIVYATDAGCRPAIGAVRREYLGSPDPVASTAPLRGDRCQGRPPRG